MIQKQGIYEADNKTIKPKVMTTFTHAAVNDVVTVAAGYIWWCKNQSKTLTYSSDGYMTILSIAAAAALLFGAKLGGALTYNYGMGMAMGKGNKGKTI